MTEPRKHVRTLNERIKIIEEIEKNPHEKRCFIAKRLGLGLSTLNSIFLKRNEIRQQIEKCGNSFKKRKTSKVSTFVELEEILFTWYQQARASKIPIDGSILREKAKTIANELNVSNFTASNGWITRFKNRHGLVFKKLTGESAEVNIESADAWLSSLPSKLEGYELQNIYNADETGLFFNVLPDRTLAFKGECCHGGKHSKERLTVLLCVNSDGSDKQIPIVIGKSLKPRCFKNVKKIPCKYYANGNAWMTTQIFISFLHSLDRQMRSQNRQIILLIDNCAAHPQDTSFLTNIKIIKYPANMTSKLQPLDLGIIHSLKAYYRKCLVQTSISLMESGKDTKMKINILEAMHYIMAAWKHVTQQTIKNCFLKAGHINDFDCNEMLNEDNEVYNSTKDWEELCIAQQYDFQSYVLIDNNILICEMETVEELSKAFNSEKIEEEEEADENAENKIPTFTETYEALQKIKDFFYARSEKRSDHENILSLEKSYFDLKQKSNKQLTIHDFFVKK